MTELQHNETTCHTADCHHTHHDSEETKVAPHLIYKARFLEYFTVGWNVCEGTLSLIFAILAGSTVLYGFGIDACIEASSGLILLWRLQVGSLGQSREKIATILVGISLMILAIYVLIDSIMHLIELEKPQISLVGLIVATISITIMPWISWQKRKIAQEMNSDALYADSKQTELCAYLSGIVILGLGLNALLGWWWADPIAALCMVPLIAIEGKNALQGKSCHCH